MTTGRVSRTTCRGCGAPVMSAPLVGEDTRIVLDVHESATGPGRYAVWDDGQARAVSASAEVLAYQVHCCDQPTLRR